MGEPLSRYKDYGSAAAALSVDKEFRDPVEEGDALLVNGECIESMRALEDGDVDLLLTDPPYNLGLFM